MKIIRIFNSGENYLDKIVSFLINENGFSVERANQRAKEILFIAVDDNLNIIGSCSGYSEYVSKLKGWFLIYRSSVSKNNRKSGIGTTLMKETISYFNENKMFNLIELNGIYIIFESELLNKIEKHITSAGFYLIGFTDSGNQIRVHYFDNSKFC